MGRDHLNLVAGCWRVNDSGMLSNHRSKVRVRVTSVRMSPNY